MGKRLIWLISIDFVIQTVFCYIGIILAEGYFSTLRHDDFVRILLHSNILAMIGSVIVVLLPYTLCSRYAALWNKNRGRTSNAIFMMIQGLLWSILYAILIGIPIVVEVLGNVKLIDTYLYSFHKDIKDTCYLLALFACLLLVLFPFFIIGNFLFIKRKNVDN